MSVLCLRRWCVAPARLFAYIYNQMGRLVEHKLLLSWFWYFFQSWSCAGCSTFSQEIMQKDTVMRAYAKQSIGTQACIANIWCSNVVLLDDRPSTEIGEPKVRVCQLRGLPAWWMHIVHPSRGDFGHKQHVVVSCMHLLLPHARFMHACVHGAWGRHAVIVIETVNHPLKIVIVIENEIENENEIVIVVTLQATVVCIKHTHEAADRCDDVNIVRICDVCSQVVLN